MKTAFQDRLGRRYEIPNEEAPRALEAGLQPIDPEVLRQEEVEKKYGDKIGQALLLSGARGLSLGLSDQILTKTGLMDAEEVKGIKEANPIASTLGEIGGAVAPAFFTGGTSLAAKAALATPAGAATHLAMRSGSKVAEKVAQKIVGDGIKQQVARKALELGTIGIVEGALFGEAQLITEEALGDAEFTAESIMGAAGTGMLFGGGAGAAMGAMAGVASRGLNKASKQFKINQLKNRKDLSKVELNEAIKRVQADEALQEGINLMEKPGVAEAAERLGVEPTPGTLSGAPIFGRLESSLAGEATPGAMAIMNKRQALDEGLQKSVERIAGGSPLNKVESGEAIRMAIADQMKSEISMAQGFYNSVFTKHGNTLVNEKVLQTGIGLMKQDIASRVVLPESTRMATKLLDLLGRARTLNDVGNVKKSIGSYGREAFRKGEQVAGEILSDAYKFASDLEVDLIKNIGLKEFGKDKKALGVFLDSWAQAKKDYSEFYKRYGDFAKEMGVKGKNAQAIIDQFSEVQAEKLANKFIDLGDVRKSQKLAQEFPEAFEVARRQKLYDEFKKSNGSVKRFVNNLDKLDDAQKTILFSGKHKQVLEDIAKVARALPPDINPSGSGFAISWRKLLSPIYQATEAARYAAYKKGPRWMQDYFNKTLPTMAAAEVAINSTNTKINSASKGYFKALRQAVNYTGTDQLTEAQIKRAEKILNKLQTDPFDFMEDMAIKSKDFTVHMPQTGRALEARLLAATEFLASKFPRRQGVILNDDYQASKSDLIKFSDYLLAIEKPMKAIEQLKSGYLNPRAMEAMKVVYPKMFQKLQQGLAVNMPKKLTPAQRSSLSVILGAKVSPVLDKRNMAILQNGKEVDMSPGAQAQAQGQAPRTTPRRPDMKAASRTQGGFDTVVNRRV